MNYHYRHLIRKHCAWRERVLKNTQSVHCPGICPVYYVQFNKRMTEKVNKVVNQIQRKRTLFYLTCSNAVRIFWGTQERKCPLVLY